MTLTAQAEKNKAKTFKPGDWYSNRAGDVVRIDDVTAFTVWGTIWKRYSSGDWVCYGTRMWNPDGRYYDASFQSLEDLTRRIRKPHWMEEVAA